ncbi:cAMP-independent regulatory protein pac2 [Rhizoctonia solani]|uniref:cAMP-independent regulatory protein pac2 n=1 Tax=Rhizoctonia solani TaxID=456999 RepID=A0A8H8P6K2_9AGAM|nr:cAMP-independent regulatory protein pac2 [Rhizoctonia solani]QRW26464.1 cAMP-independent regulatory protein pac2 [Rhizoctonia solani]
MPQQVTLTPTHFIPRTKATHQRLHIRSARDAHTVFEAVRLGMLPMVTQRLSVVDCELLQPGQVYCWEQENGESGIERWTDGRRWGGSRARENFLFYIEAQPRLEQEEGSSSIDDYQIPQSQKAPWDFRQDKRCGGFTKQTYSAWVKFSPMHPPRRWNLTAYFAGEDYLNLPTVDSDPIFSKFDIPPGVYTTFDSLLKKSERRSVISADLSETLDPEYPVLPKADNQDNPTSPLPRSPEDQRALSMFKLQL